MSCAICKIELCYHGSITCKSGISKCNLCNEVSEKNEPIYTYSLPMRNGVVNWNSKVCMPVCKICYWLFNTLNVIYKPDDEE